MTRESGSALLVALAALVVVGLAVLMVASQLEAYQVSLRHDYRRAVLDALSDAAFADSLARLAADPAYQGAAPRSFSSGIISSVVEPAGPTSRRVVASAQFLGWVATIDSEVDVTAGPRIVRVTRTERPVVERNGGG